MRLRFCRHLEQPRCQQFPWADDGSLSLISARWLTLMDAGHESRPALISARSFTKTPEVEFRGGLSTGLSLKMKMSPRIHSGTSGSCKNEAAQKNLTSIILQFCAEDKRCEKSVTHCRCAPKMQKGDEECERLLTSRLPRIMAHVSPAPRSLQEGNARPNSGKFFPRTSCYYSSQPRPQVPRNLK